jgi:hypothetical protein
MSLLQIFDDSVESMKRSAAVVALALTPLFMTGCANTKLNLPEGNFVGIPVGRVLNQSVNPDVYDAKKGLKQGIMGQVRGTACKDENGHVTGVVFGDPRQCDAQKNNDVGPRPAR